MTDTDILERLREEVEYTPVVGATRYRLVSLLGAVEREIERLRAEVEEWKDRYEAERDDHEATTKHADESR